MSSEVDTFAARSKRALPIFVTRKLASLYSGDGMRKGSQKKRRRQKGPKEVKRSVFLKIPSAGIFPSRFHFRFQGKKSIFD